MYLVLRAECEKETSVVFQDSVTLVDYEVTLISRKMMSVYSKLRN